MYVVFVDQAGPACRNAAMGIDRKGTPKDSPPFFKLRPRESGWQGRWHSKTLSIEAIKSYHVAEADAICTTHG
jgi:hypothetical protein